MTGSTEPIDLVFDGDVAWLTLTRPDDGNAINLELAHGLRRGIALISNASPRVIVIGGTGGSFCVGGDVMEMAAAADLSAYIGELAGTFHHALADLADLDAVIVAAVDGVAAGAGLGLALAADIQLASDRAVFLTAYETLGLTPDSGTSLLLPLAIGMPRARAMSAAGMRVDAASAAAIGLAQEVVSPNDLPAAVRDLAKRLAAKPQSHMAATRRLYRGAQPDHYRRHLDAETLAITAAGASADARRLIHDLAARSARSAEARRRRASRAAA